MTDFKEETRILVDLVKKRYGDRLTKDQLEAVEKQLSNNLETAKGLYSVELKNSDEPYNVFKPYRRKE
jgi:hypothetical protein